MRNKQEPRTDGPIDVENHGAVLVARIDGGPHALFDAALTKQLKELVDRADRDQTFMPLSLLARIPIDS